MRTTAHSWTLRAHQVTSSNHVHRLEPRVVADVAAVACDPHDAAAAAAAMSPLAAELRVVSMANIGWLLVGGFMTLALFHFFIADSRRTDWLVLLTFGWVMGCTLSCALLTHNLVSHVEQRWSRLTSAAAADSTTIQMGRLESPEAVAGSTTTTRPESPAAAYADAPPPPPHTVRSASAAIVV